MDLQLSRFALYSQAWDLVFTQFAIFISIVTGYLVVAYTAGPRLSKIQVVLASGLYLFAALVVANGMINVTLNAETQAQEFIHAYIEMGEVELAAVWQSQLNFSMEKYTSRILVFLIILTPLYFMWTTRRNDTNGT